MTWTLANPTTDENNPRRILVRDGIRQFCPFQQDVDGGQSIWCGNWCPLFEETDDMMTKTERYHIVELSCSNRNGIRTIEDTTQEGKT